MAAEHKELPQLLVWALKQTPLVVILLFANYMQFQQVQRLEFKVETMQAKLDLYMIQSTRKTNYSNDRENPQFRGSSKTFNKL